MTLSDSALGTSWSFMNSRTLFSMSWYLAVAEVICWMMVVTWPKMVAYSSAANNYCETAPYTYLQVPT